MPYVPTAEPQLSDMVYEMIIAHYLTNDRKVSIQFFNFLLSKGSGWRADELLPRPDPSRAATYMESLYLQRIQRRQRR